MRFSVSDTGSGIEPARTAELFQPFSRLGAETRAIDGTGVGLALTRHLVEMMGGRVGFESTPGQGSTFWLEVPAAKPGVPPGASGTAATQAGMPAL